MQRVRLEYKELVKTRILESANELFSRKGYQDTSMDEIASGLGLSKAALYRYYPGKEELFRELVKQMIEGATVAVREAFKDSRLDPDLFFSILRQWIWTPKLFFSAASEAGRNPKLREIFESGYSGAVAALEDFLDEQKERGIIRKSVKAKHIAMGAIALHDGLLASELGGVDESERGQALADTFEAMLHGILESNSKRSGDSR